jgi:hypothetical protein
VNDLPDAETVSVIKAARTAIASYRSRLAAEHSAIKPKATTGLLGSSQEWRNVQLSTNAMMHAITQKGLAGRPRAQP